MYVHQRCFISNSINGAWKSQDLWEMEVLNAFSSHQDLLIQALLVLLHDLGVSTSQHPFLCLFSSTVFGQFAGHETAAESLAESCMCAACTPGCRLLSLGGLNKLVKDLALPTSSSERALICHSFLLAAVQCKSCMLQEL